MDTIILYGFVFSLSSLLGCGFQFFETRKRMNTLKNVLLAAFLIASPIIVVMSIRYGIGTDYFNYERIFIYYKENYFTRLEPGFSLLMDVALGLSDEFQCLVLLSAVLTVTLSVCTLLQRKTSYLGLQVFVLCCLYFGLWCNAIRQSIALGFISLAIVAVLNRRIFFYIILVTLAGMFHSSSFALYPLFLFVLWGEGSFEQQKWKLCLSLFLAVVFSVFFLQFGKSYDVLYSNYITSTREGGRIWIYLFLAFFFYVPEVFCLKKICLINNKNIFLYIMILFECVFFLLSIKVAYAFRMSCYFSLAHLFLIPQTLLVCSNKNSRFLLKLYYILFLAFYFYITTFVFKLNGIDVYDVFYRH